MLQGGGQLVVNAAEALGAFRGFCRGSGAEQLQSLLSQFAVSFDDERDQVRVWVTSSLVVFPSLCSVVSVWGGVVRCGVVGERVCDGNVDQVVVGLVGRDNVHHCTVFVGGARVSIKLGEVLFESGMVTMLFEPFVKDPLEAVVFVQSVSSGAAGGGVLCVFVKLLETLGGGACVVAVMCGVTVEREAEAKV